jgi:hypothetical protein
MSTTDGLKLLRQPFPAHQISKLPKPTKKDAPKGKCQECGGWHGLPAVHLDYVGHAALTDRLLDADPNWSWEPLSIVDGLPVLDPFGGMWIKLTVCGVTRLGYGHAGDKTGGDAIKEIIGDALRNAAMRFGAALDLWHKGDLHADEGDKPGSLETLLEKSIEQARQSKVITGTDGIEDLIPEKRRNELDELALMIVEAFKGERHSHATDLYYSLEENDEKTYVWKCLKAESKLRALIKANSPHQQKATT